MERSSKPELTRRINRAFSLLEQGLAQGQVVEALKRELGVSEIQAYRYVQQARQNIALLPIPELTKTFTVKLAHSLIEKVRDFSRSESIPISHVVSDALEDFLNQKGDGQEEGQQAN